MTGSGGSVRRRTASSTVLPFHGWGYVAKLRSRGMAAKLRQRRDGRGRRRGGTGPRRRPRGGDQTSLSLNTPMSSALVPCSGTVWLIDASTPTQPCSTPLLSMISSIGMTCELPV